MALLGYARSRHKLSQPRANKHRYA
jgi:hypothetical protein